MSYDDNVPTERIPVVTGDMDLYDHWYEPILRKFRGVDWSPMAILAVVAVLGLVLYTMTIDQGIGGVPTPVSGPAGIERTHS